MSKPKKKYSAVKFEDVAKRAAALATQAEQDAKRLKKKEEDLETALVDLLVALRKSVGPSLRKLVDVRAARNWGDDFLPFWEGAHYGFSLETGDYVRAVPPGHEPRLALPEDIAKEFAASRSFPGSDELVKGVLDMIAFVGDQERRHGTVKAKNAHRAKLIARVLV